MKKLLSAITLVAVASTITPFSVQAAPLDGQQQQQVRELVRSTLVENPDILVEAISELRKRELQAQENAQKTSLEAKKDELFNTPGDPFIGNPKGKVAMVYFADYNCGHCKRQDLILEQMVKQHPDLKIIYKELPVLGGASREVAELVLAAHKNHPDVYQKLHQRLMSRPGRHDSTSIAAAFKAEGLDIETLKKKVDNNIKAKIDNNLRLASELGIRGTPATVFADEVLGGFTKADQLSEKIKSRLN
ncbi:DsbA family protein [Endozoicomonas euniceicola]|uniref:DsbA family protein n=1 Tax=Endozoicomonas euniceicola TaxID=1234143 RepID=A0ABY6GQ61_9GAMM|nr:DsbA family protein [Endozoicomonas euniceicola]UYM14233.1 DsbA family protein [Endozoicomonas euniceicola]